MTPALLAAGLAAGFVDSVVGGGGLITVPAMMLQLGVGPLAIGTNKIAGAAATLAAAAVYGSKGHMPWRPALRFGALVGLGSLLGAAVSPRWLAPFYKHMLWAGTLLCVGTLVLKRGLPGKAHSRADFPLTPAAAALGVAVGFYDGAWGPGGGTFMFLALYHATPASLVGAMAAAKVANLISALLALSAYAAQGQVRWGLGAAFSLTLMGGALAGASLAVRGAERIAAPLLALVSAALLWRLAAG